MNQKTDDIQDEAAAEVAKPEKVEETEYCPCFSTMVLSWCNSALEISIAYHVYKISGSLLLSAVSWISLLFLETKYLLFRKPALGQICVRNLQKARREMHNLLPEVSLINLGLFVLLRLVFLYR